MNRRKFIQESANSLLLYAFYHFASATNAWGKPIESVTQKWVQELGEICSSVQNGRMSPQDWQLAIERLHRKISLEEIVRFVDLEQAVKRVKYPRENFGGIENVAWPRVDGFPRDLKFGHKLFVYRKGSCTPPHAHNHLVSAHLVVSGDIHIRTFDRIYDLEKSILIRPSRDEIAKPGTVISMSDYCDNIHWFEGTSDISVSFDIPVPGIEPKKAYKQPANSYDMIFLDPGRGTNGSDGTMEAPVISFADSVRTFG